MLCLNMIVKNESARILRALEAAKPYISTYAIYDTGSTDNTVEIIQKWAAENDIEGIIAHGVFVNFSDARNLALKLARSWRFNHGRDFKYLLLQDADMELVVDNVDAFKDLTEPAYDMMQTGGTVTYANKRLLHIDSTAEYVGVTHEFLSVEGDKVLPGARFVDHADGANRVQKFQRDIDLLLPEVQKNPRDDRSWFYLGNSYRDAGMAAEAKHAYEQRLALGGWDEELYVTQCNLACCCKDLGDEPGFVHAMLKAHEMRPRRAEPLYDLAKHYREAGAPNSAMPFIERGFAIPRPDDRLFVNDFVYSHGFREELSITGYYVEGQRERAFKATNALALDPTAPHWSRALARTNMVHYLPRLAEMAPSTEHQRIAMDIDDGYTAMNPSVCARPSGVLEAIVRTVNYKINEHGQYMIGPLACGDAPIITENYLVEFDSKFNVVKNRRIIWGRDEQPKYDMVLGLEDMRLFWHRGERHFVACVREQRAHGVPQQWQGRLVCHAEHVDVVGAHCISGEDEACEKNWSPLFRNGLWYGYRLNEFVNPSRGLKEKFDRNVTVDNISGSSPWVPFLGGQLSVVHEAINHPSHGRRVYQHRFAYISNDLFTLRLSLPFVFQDVQIEFCAGLSPVRDFTRYIMSYGLKDEEPWLATISARDIAALLQL